MRNVVPTHPVADEASIGQVPARDIPPSGPIASSTDFPAPSQVRLRPRRRITTYDRVTRIFGLLVGVILMIALWTVGSYFTLTWLASIGFAPARVGVAFVDMLLGRGPSIQVHWLNLVIAWFIPAAITIAEIGLWPVRTRHPFTWLIFLVVLLFSSFTTAAGLALSLNTDPITAWVTGGLLGVILDLVPEKGLRILWRLLWES